MTESNYVSASQVSIYVGNIWLDDASHIELNQMSAKVPYYGYNDTHYRAIGQGKVLVTGAITIQFRYANYLTKAVMMARKGQDLLNLSEAVKMTSMVKAVQKSEMLGTKDFVSAEEFAEVLEAEAVTENGLFSVRGLGAAASLPAEANRLSRYLKGRFWGEKDVVEELLEDYKIGDKMSKNPYMAMTDPRVQKRVDIIVNYDPGDSVNNPELVKVIEDVHFTSEGSRIDNSRAEYGGAPIAERYEFMAKQVVPLSLRGK